MLDLPTKLAIAIAVIALVVVVIDSIADRGRPAVIVEADDTKKWPSLLDWIGGVLFVVLFFGVLVAVGHGAGF